MPPYHWEDPPSADWEPGEKIATVKRKAETMSNGRSHLPVCMFHDCDGRCDNYDHEVTWITRCKACGQLWRRENQLYLRVVKRTFP